MKYFDYYSSPLGTMLIIEENNVLTHLTLSDNTQVLSNFPADSLQQKSSSVISSAKIQLNEYFKGTRKIFQLPLNPIGTPFQKKVWNVLCTIPFGETRSYKEIALQIENPKGCRAVGMANNRNPIMLIIPCHRVIGTDGSLIGYAGGIEIKKWLLEHERTN
ncbi:MAG: methylated-DNA--[protein]-cysteine S-methyltransferase [Lachnospiraceae bacterium]